MAAVTYDANNHQTGIGYDANGNQAVGFYSVENRLQAFGSTQYEYDPFGKRVAVKTPNDDGTTNYQFSFYGITGQRLATVGCTENSDFSISSCWVTGQNIYFKGKMLVSNGVGVVTDRLGSVRG